MKKNIHNFFENKSRVDDYSNEEAQSNENALQAQCIEKANVIGVPTELDSRPDYVEEEYKICEDAYTNEPLYY
jgi:hypothetical protein